MNWNDIILTVFSGSSPVMAIILGLMFYRQNRRTKDLENDRRELDNRSAANRIEIDAATKSRLVEEAATINEDREQRREDWWGRQIAVLRAEIDAERTLSYKRFRRLNQLEEWATRHVMWDRKAWVKIGDPDFEKPPELPDELEVIFKN